MSPNLNNITPHLKILYIFLTPSLKYHISLEFCSQYFQRNCYRQATINLFIHFDDNLSTFKLMFLNDALSEPQHVLER